MILLFCFLPQTLSHILTHLYWVSSFVLDCTVNRVARSERVVADNQVYIGSIKPLEFLNFFVSLDMVWKEHIFGNVTFSFESW